MITQLIKKLARLDENDRKVKNIHRKNTEQIRGVTLILKRSGKLQQIMIKKTTTFYIAKAIGIVK